MKTGTGLKYLFPFSLFQYVLGIKIKNMCPFAELFMYDAVAELGELTAVPAACGADEVAGDALELVDVLSAAVRALGQALLGVLEAAVHAAVAVVVH